MTTTLGTITIPVELKLNVTAETERLDAETADAVDMLIRLKKLGLDHSERCEIINIAERFAAYGVTEELVDIFGKIAASMQITTEDLWALRREGIQQRFASATDSDIITPA